MVLISSVTLLGRLNSKAADSLDGSDYNLSKAIVGLAFINLLLQVPYLVVDLVLLYIDRAWDAYDLSDTIDTNIRYTSVITSKAKDFQMCITFWILIFSRHFRSAFCKN